MSRSINPMPSGKNGTLPFRLRPDPIVLMSLRPAIPWRVALQHGSSPLHQSIFIVRPLGVSVNRGIEIGDSSLDFCVPVKANYQLPGWAKLDDRSGPGRTIKLTERPPLLIAAYDKDSRHWRRIPWIDQILGKAISDHNLMGSRNRPDSESEDVWRRSGGV